MLEAGPPDAVSGRISVRQVSDLYVPRIVDGLLDKLLYSFPAISLVGPRAAGKTITAVRRGGAVLRLGRSSTVS